MFQCSCCVYAVRYQRNFIWCLQNFKLEVGQGEMLPSVPVILHIQSLTRQQNAVHNTSYQHISFEKMTWICTLHSSFSNTICLYCTRMTSQHFVLLNETLLIHPRFSQKFPVRSAMLFDYTISFTWELVASLSMQDYRKRMSLHAYKTTGRRHFQKDSQKAIRKSNITCHNRVSEFYTLCVTAARTIQLQKRHSGHT